jgi:hypothetical protein
MKKKDYNPYFDDIDEDKDFYCPICNRLTPEKFIEKHHLVPKAKKGKKVEEVCVNCGDMVHKVFSLKELEREYNTIEKINSHQEIKKWVQWIQNKPDDFSVCMKNKKGKKGKKSK